MSVLPRSESESRCAAAKARREKGSIAMSGSFDQQAACSEGLAGGRVVIDGVLAEQPQGGLSGRPDRVAHALGREAVLDDLFGRVAREARDGERVAQRVQPRLERARDEFGQ